MYVRALALGCFYSHISTQALHTQVAAFTGERAEGKKDEASKRQQKENIKSQKLNSVDIDARCTNGFHRHRSCLVKSLTIGTIIAMISTF